MTRKTLTLPIPWLTPEKRQVATHFIEVFAIAFATSLVANQQAWIHLNTALGALGSAAAAGVVALAHYFLEIVPTPSQVRRDGLGKVGLVLISKPQIFTVLMSAAVTFTTILGSQLLAGAAGAQTLPDLKAVYLSAFAAAATGVVTYFSGLIPTPKGTPPIT